MPKLHSSVNFTPYLPLNASDQLKKYVYRGEDRSLLYKHGWKPLCRKLCPMLPYWLAPNVITVAALIFVIFNHIMLAKYMPDLGPNIAEYGDCPSWVFLAAGGGLLIYQLLDNLDGHQARRLGVSSPLGLLMDHGCDAFNCIIGSLSVCAAAGAGPTWKSWWLFLCTVVAFFMNTWEEYYRGELILPIVNGPNEGIFLAVFVYLLSAAFGVTFWTNNFITFPVSILPSFLQRDFVNERLLAIAKQTHIAHLGYSESRPPETYVAELIHSVYGPANVAGPVTRYPFFGASLSPAPASTTFSPQPATNVDNSAYNSNNIDIAFNTIAILVICAATTATALGNIYQVCVAVRKQEEGQRHGRYGTGWLIRRFPFLHALTRLMPLAVVTVIAHIWFAASPGYIFRAHPRLFCWTVGFLFTKLAIHLMVAHLCSIEFHPFRRTLVPFFYLIGHFGFSVYYHYLTEKRGTSFLDETVTLFEFFLLSAISFAHLTVNVIDETSDALGVPVFTVPKEKQLQARRVEEADYFVSSPVHDRRQSEVEKELKRLSQSVAAHESPRVIERKEAIIQQTAASAATPTKQRISAEAGELPNQTVLRRSDQIILDTASPLARKPAGKRTSSAKPPAAKNV